MNNAITQKQSVTNGSVIVTVTRIRKNARLTLKLESTSTEPVSKTFVAKRTTLLKDAFEPQTHEDLLTMSTMIRDYTEKQPGSDMWHYLK